ncbi:MAG: hypothetical protein FWE65_01515, partial [Eggerthellaceae bacterium]|nr:hypothetical protein [Eggerthellaceae bacterium]
MDENKASDNEVGGITAISIRTYLTAFVVLIILMVAAFVLTQVLPAGEFERVMVDGSEVVVPTSFHTTEGNLPFWKWILSPILILGGPNNVILIMLLIFLFAIGGAFFALESCGVLSFLITSVAKRFEHNNRLLLFILPFIFMLLGTLIGSFEEVIPLTAIVVALSLRLGWDRFLGLGLSLLAVGCGFAVGVMNPFTVGIAQTIAGLPLFSGAWYRIICFVVVYGMLMAFLLWNARRCERANRAAGIAPASAAPLASAVDKTQTQAGTLDGEDENPLLSKALRAFLIVLGIGITAIIACSAIPVDGLSDLVFPVTALTFLMCGIIAPLRCGHKAKELFLWFLKGVKAIAPGALLVLMASSISFMLTEAKVLDTLIYYSYNFLVDKPGYMTLQGMYALTLLLEFAIPSASAKAFLLIPLLAPLVDLVDIPRQLLILSYT